MFYSIDEQPPRPPQKKNKKMQLTFQNLLYFVGRLAPMVLVSFFVLVSIFNQDWKGLVYLSGIIAACFLAIIMSNTTEQLFDTNDKTISSHCSLGTTRFSYYPLSSVIIGFSIMYIFLPMIKMTEGISNPFLIMLMLLFMFVDVIFLVRNRCSSMFINNTSYGVLSSFIPIFVAYGMGGFVAFAYVLMATSTDHNELLYFGTDSAGPLCKLSGKNKMRCRVYKNGELVTTS
jgi:hypothetical protein